MTRFISLPDWRGNLIPNGVFIVLVAVVDIFIALEIEMFIGFVDVCLGNRNHMRKVVASDDRNER